MKHLRKWISACSVMFILFATVFPSYAASSTISYNYNETNVFTNQDNSSIEYTESRDDGLYFISEHFSGDSIDSKIYKIEDGKNRFISTIHSKITNNEVICAETKANGETDRYKISIDVIENKSQITPYFRSARYIRTEKSEISLLGKRITIGIVATAIIAVTPMMPFAVATKIVIAAIAGAGGGGVGSLPNYLYVTTDIYSSQLAGKRYRRYENRYYLDRARTQCVGSWTFSKRWGNGH